MTAPVLTPITVTEKYRSRRTGRFETWAAKSRDGMWAYNRSEEPRTPWIVTYLPTGEQVPLWFSTLTRARAWTADGRALRLIERERERAPLSAGAVRR